MNDRGQILKSPLPKRIPLPPYFGIKNLIHHPSTSITQQTIPAPSPAAHMLLAIVRFLLVFTGIMDENNYGTCPKPLLDKKLVIATRLHLGKATSPHSEEKLAEIVGKFERLARNVDGATKVIAVDSTPKIEGYDYVEAIRKALPEDSQTNILPVTPWGKFTPALNALVTYAVNLNADLILFVSAEVNASEQTISTLCHHVTEDKDTVVAGAALPGHAYSAGEVELNGRTCPWNTLAVWSLEKLSLTGFQLCSDLGSTAGIEECVAFALIQKLFPESKAKLVKLDDIRWEQTFDDEERRKWHEFKMKSKTERAQIQMGKINLASIGSVVHC